MTRKDYVKFAEMLKQIKIDSNVQGAGYYGLLTFDDLQHNVLAHKTADIFAADNSRFDRVRYLAACGVKS